MIPLYLIDKVIAYCGVDEIFLMIKLREKRTSIYTAKANGNRANPQTISFRNEHTRTHVRTQTEETT